MRDEDRLEDLRLEARHARQRYDLYRAKMYGLRPSSPTRLRELEKAAEAAEARYRYAREQAAAQGE